MCRRGLSATESTSLTPLKSHTLSIAPSFIENLDLEAIRLLAVRTRFDTDDNAIERCEVCAPPIVGGYNVVFPIHFSDGVKWVLRTPIEDWSPIREQAMRSSIIGMRYIQDRTSIPIPTIHDFSTTFDNPLGRPYMILSHIEGIQLDKVWYDPSWLTDERRLRIFESIAENMSQLSTLTFQQIGDLDFDPETEEHLVRPWLITDPWGASCTEHGPYSTVHSCLFDGISKEIQSTNDRTELTFLALLRLFAASLPEERWDSGPFCLSFPDFNLQNIFVDDNGRVTGMIDWDDVSIGPWQSGFASYPTWLTSDWHPLFYAWRDSNGSISRASEEVSSDGSSEEGDGGTAGSACEAGSEEEGTVEGCDLGAESTLFLEPGECIGGASAGDVSSASSNNEGIEKSQQIDSTRPGSLDNGAAGMLSTPCDQETNPDPSNLRPISERPTECDDRPLRLRYQADSPETLEAFRKEYLEIYSRVDPDNAQATARSHIMRAIEAAILMPPARSGILAKLWEYVLGKKYAGSGGPMYWYFVAEAIGFWR